MYTSQRLRSNKSVVLIALDKSSYVLKYVSEELQKDKTAAIRSSSTLQNSFRDFN